MALIPASNLFKLDDINILVVAVNLIVIMFSAQPISTQKILS